MIGYIMFRLADRELACRLDDVREVVRLTGLEVLPGMTPPVSGWLELRGNPLPIVDLRPGDAASRAAERGDVLVLATGVEAIGVVVNQVTAVHDEDELLAVGDDRPAGLPHYVVEVLRRGGVGPPVLLVDLQRLLTVAAA
ncbi:MAG: purine-binding chemotaxis protein CheW [Actinomycetota bacterium]|jgi:chemotaxis signal transduction protein|nr:purine-binding chemotaxis protein CheW [Actinomycetota bacterium]